MFDLTGKVAIVTGGGGGLGRPIAVGLAQCGADVVVDEPRRRRIWRRSSRTSRRWGRKALAVSADVTSAASMKAMVDQVMKELRARSTSW